MGVFGAMTTALSGLRAQSYALENISGNIANSRTTGFKRVDTSFSDLIPDTPANRELAGSVLSRSLATNSVQGDIATSNISTHVALNGDGFFIVAEKLNTLNGTPSFSQTNLYTRRGDFSPDADGYLVNGAGNYLKGLTLDPLTGNPTGSNAQVIRIPDGAIAPRATTSIEYRATLPRLPETAAYTATGNNGNPLDPNEQYLVNPLSTPAATFPASPPALNTIAASDNGAFISRSLPGNQVTVYDSLGSPVVADLRWAKEAAPGPHTWSLYVQTDPAATGAAAQWTRVGAAAQWAFTPAGGGLIGPTTAALPNITANGITVTGITLSTGAGGNGLKQFTSGDTGQVNSAGVTQDGYSAGVLQGTNLSSEGQVMGTYSNGLVRPLAQLLTARFSAPDSLKRLDGGTFGETVESGLPLIGTATAGGTQLVGGALEQSNTDIADEFSKMIVTQQAYSANTRVITTSQQMLSDILNIIR